MEYRVGTPGRVIIARFGDNEDLLAGLAAIARRENLKAACFSLVGGMKGGRYVVGPEGDEMPPRPVWRELRNNHEAFGFGTIFWCGDEPKVHFHGAYGRGDEVRAGCLREASRTFLVVEAVITELLGTDAVRSLDPASGFALLAFGSGGRTP
ncbi:PPC domain-containing DNA-binding protein [Trichlorobacter ammonificans]|uniref:PPC domain-containing protein n=1 Tax=Trichlorobacter ammonificans TaxID=2916410 RepID=A0ABM9DCI7_9BACT|nr:PPC domain-containing DNA-binding protein [Trichlorobacter ammonificans]CAH2032054.1 PPC domain-containing protein [Trichlorobacter ammonificans]